MTPDPPYRLKGFKEYSQEREREEELQKEGDALEVHTSINRKSQGILLTLAILSHCN